MSKEYIEKEIVVDYLRHKLCSKCQEFESWTPEECKDCLATTAIKSIEMANPASVAPVVRCKDCVYHIDGRCYNPKLQLRQDWRGDDWFCADGTKEKKDEQG